MKKTALVLFVIIVIVILFFPKPMGYSGGFTGGKTYFAHCVGFAKTHQNTGPQIPDGIDSTTYCLGIPFN